MPHSLGMVWVWRNSPIHYYPVKKGRGGRRRREEEGGGRGGG